MTLVINVYARNDFKNNLHLTKELEALLKEGGSAHNHHSLLKGKIIYRTSLIQNHINKIY